MLYSLLFMCRFGFLSCNVVLLCCCVIHVSTPKQIPINCILYTVEMAIIIINKLETWETRLNVWNVFICLFFFKTTSCLQSKRLYRLGHGHGDHTVGTGFTNIYRYDATTNNKWEENSSKQFYAELIWSACLVQRLGANTSNALAERKEGQRLLAY